MRPWKLQRCELVIPERDLRCIFEAIFVGDDLGANMPAGLVDEAVDWADISVVICLDSSKPV